MKRIYVALGLLIFTTILSAQNVGVGTATPNSTLEINGSEASKVTTITGNTTLDVNNSIVLCNSASNITVTLPTAVSINGRKYSIKNINTGVVTIVPTSGQLIDGLPIKLLFQTNEVVEIISNGSNWYFLSDVNVSPKPGTFLFATDQSVSNNYFIGLGTSSSTFLRNSIVAPFDCELSSITFSIRSTSFNMNIVASVWVNNIQTSLSTIIFDGTYQISASDMGSVFVLKGDLISVQLSWVIGGALSNGIAAAVTYK